jgi:hypothetical protein
MSVAARGGLPFTYQWPRDGTNLTGATSSNYVIAVAALTNAGLYRVVVSNQYGFAESVLTSISTYSGNITNDLVLHLTLDGNVDDSSGRGNNGTLAGQSATGR